MYRYSLGAALLAFCLCLAAAHVLDVPLPVPVSLLFFLAIIMAQADFAKKGRLTAPLLAYFGTHVRPGPATRQELHCRMTNCVIGPLLPCIFILYFLAWTVALSSPRVAGLALLSPPNLASTVVLCQAIVFGLVQVWATPSEPRH